MKKNDFGRQLDVAVAERIVRMSQPGYQFVPALNRLDVIGIVVAGLFCLLGIILSI